MDGQAQAREKFQWWARIGYCTRGMVYLLVGALAILAAVGEGGKTTGTKGALATIIGEPFGYVLLGIIALGLFGYAAWRFIQAVFDADNHGNGGKALAIRGGLLISSLTHVLLGIFAASLAFGSGGGGGSGGNSGWVAELMQQPWGRWMVALIGIGILVAGIAHAVKAYKAKYRKHLAMDGEMMDKVEPMIRFGLYARSVVFAIIAFFFVIAAWQYDPQKAKGLNAALEFLQGQAYGMILLLIIALGLVAFGAYSVIEGIYRRIEPR